MESMKLADGRTLAYEIQGAADGVPVFFSHGLSDSRLIRNPDDELTASLGVRWISADQPGVGGSTRQRGRTLRDWASDIEQLADALGVERFVVAGHSGGGPHVMAIAACLPDRVTHGVLAAPISPIDMDGFSELIPERSMRLIFKLRRPPFVLRGLLNAYGWWGNRDIGKFLESAAPLDRSDHNTDTFTADRAQRAMFEASFAAGLEQGGEGLIEMLEALWDWGFTLADVPQHFELFHGSLDNMLGPDMGKAIVAALPDANFNSWPGAGHYGFVDRERWTEFLTAAAA